MPVARLLAVAMLATPLLITPLLSQAQETNQATSDEQIKKQIIAECIALYRQSRPCPCPYSGGRCLINAWFIPTGAKPFCYNEDISKTEITQYQSGNKSFITARCTARQ